MVKSIVLGIALMLSSYSTPSLNRECIKHILPSKYSEFQVSILDQYISREYEFKSESLEKEVGSIFNSGAMIYWDRKELGYNIEFINGTYDIPLGRAIIKRCIR